MIRLAASQTTLMVFSLLILLGVLGIMTEQLRFLLANHQLDFIPSEIDLEEDIAILIVAFGVLLEHRFWLLERIYPNGVPAPVQKLDLYSQKFGIFLIIIAVIIECFDMAFLALNIWGFDHSGLKYFEISILFSANVVASLSIARYCFKILLNRTVPG